MAFRPSVSLLALLGAIAFHIAYAAPKHEPKPQESFAPYWTAEPGWRTELQMRNNLAHGDLTVVPVLRDHDGTEFPLSPVTVAPNEVKSVDVSEAVVKETPQLAGSYGSVVFRFTSPSYKNLYAAVMVFDGGHPIAFHMDAFADVPEFNAGSREGIWWLPSATVRDYLVLTNKSQRPLPTTLRLYDAKGKSFTEPILLKPRAIERFSVRELLQRRGWRGNTAESRSRQSLAPVRWTRLISCSTRQQGSPR